MGEKEKVPKGYKMTEVGVIPSEWEVRPLKDISPKQSVGLVINPSTYHSKDGTVPLLVGSNVSENIIHAENANRITQESNDLLASSRLRAGDLVMVRVGDPGVTAVVPPELDKSNCASMMIIRQHQTFDSFWLCNMLNSPLGRHHILRVQYGTAQKQFNISDAVNFRYPLPPLPEQQKIAEILTSVDETIESTLKVIAQTKTVKQGLLQELLTKGIGHTKFKDTEIGRIPAEWEVVRLEDIANVERGKFSARPRNDPQYYGGTIPFVQTGDVSRSNGRLTSHSQTLNELGKTVSKIFPVNTILVTIAANIGDTALTTYEIACPDSLVGIVTKDGHNPFWLQFFLSTQKEFLESKSTQNAQKNINLQVLKPLLVALPSTKEQQQIASILTSIDNRITAQEKELEALQQMKKGLMQDLLTGKVRVRV